METVQSVPSKRRRDRFPATRRTFSIRRLEWTSKTVERCDAFEAPTSLKMTTSEKDVLEELHFSIRHLRSFFRLFSVFANKQTIQFYKK